MYNEKWKKFESIFKDVERENLKKEYSNKIKKKK